MNELDMNFLNRWGKEHSQKMGFPLGSSPTPRMMGKAVATEMDLVGSELTALQKRQLLSLVELLIDVLSANDQSTYNRVMSRILNDLNMMGLIPPTQPALGEAMIRTGSGQLVPESAYRSMLRRLIKEEQGNEKPGMMQKAGQFVKSAVTKLFGGETPSDISPEQQERNRQLAKKMAAELTKTNVIPKGSLPAGEHMLTTVVDVMSRVDDPQATKQLAAQLGQAASKLPVIQKKAKAAQQGKPNNTPESGPKNKPMNKPMNKPNNLPR